MNGTWKKLVSLTAGILVAGAVSADVIYEHNFSGSSSTYLSNTVVDTVTADSKWGASSAWVPMGPNDNNIRRYRADGSLGSDFGTGQRTAFYLPVTILDQHIYTFTMELTGPTVGNGSVFSFGFTSVADINFVITGSGGVITINDANGAMPVVDGNNINIGSHSHSGEYTVTLKTDGDDWTYTYYIDTVAVYTNVVSGGTASAVNYVGFGIKTYPGTGLDIDKLILTVEPVPEASTIGLFIISGAGALLLRRVGCKG